METIADRRSDCVEIIADCVDTMADCVETGNYHVRFASSLLR